AAAFLLQRFDVVSLPCSQGNLRTPKHGIFVWPLSRRKRKRRLRFHRAASANYRVAARITPPCLLGDQFLVRWVLIGAQVQVRAIVSAEIENVISRRLRVKIAHNLGARSGTYVVR